MMLDRTAKATIAATTVAVLVRLDDPNVAVPGGIEVDITGPVGPDGRIEGLVKINVVDAADGAGDGGGDGPDGGGDGGIEEPDGGGDGGIEGPDGGGDGGIEGPDGAGPDGEGPDGGGDGGGEGLDGKGDGGGEGPEGGGDDAIGGLVKINVVDAAPGLVGPITAVVDPPAALDSAIVEVDAAIVEADGAIDELVDATGEVGAWHTQIVVGDTIGVLVCLLGVEPSIGPPPTGYLK